MQKVGGLSLVTKFEVPSVRGLTADFEGLGILHFTPMFTFTHFIKPHLCLAVSPHSLSAVALRTDKTSRAQPVARFSKALTLWTLF